MVLSYIKKCALQLCVRIKIDHLLGAHWAAAIETNVGRFCLDDCALRNDAAAVEIGDEACDAVHRN